MVLGMMMSDIFAEMQQISGIGMLGIGGAIGPGNAANAGYQGRPGTVTWSCQFLNALETPLATASRCLAIFPVIAAQDGAFLIRVSSSGPFRHPGVPMALMAITVRFSNLACSFHMLWANCTASIILSWKSLNPLPTSSQLFWWGLYPGFCGMNQGGMTVGAPLISPASGSRSRKYFSLQPFASPEAFCVGSLRPLAKNLRLPRILMGLRPGMLTSLTDNRAAARRWCPPAR